MSTSSSASAPIQERLLPAPGCRALQSLPCLLSTALLCPAPCSHGCEPLDSMSWLCHAAWPQLPGLFDVDHVAEQLRQAGILEAVCTRSANFPFACPSRPSWTGRAQDRETGTSGPGLTRQAPLEWLPGPGGSLGKTDPLSQGPFFHSLSPSPSICVSFPLFLSHPHASACLCAFRYLFLLANSLGVWHIVGASHNH